MPPPVDPEKIAAALSPEGSIAEKLTGYEHRPQQVRFAQRVAATLEGEGILAAEAGTGVGKSLAYLLPAIHWGREHESRVIVSTNTIHLQEQLIGKDLPFLARNGGIEFKAVLLKGRANYVCIRKVRELREAPALLPDEGVRDELASIAEWTDETNDGSLSDLSFVPRPDAWEAVAAEHDDCLRARCPDYDACFFYRARREAAEADLLVVNHHLLLADLALRTALPDEAASGVLPPAGRLILDEAHHLEEAATGHFGARITHRRVERLIARLQHPRSPERGLLPALMAKLTALTSSEDRFTAAGAARWIEADLRPRLRPLLEMAGRTFNEVLSRLADELRRWKLDTGEVRSLRLVAAVREGDFWKRSEPVLRELQAQVSALVEAIAPVLRRIADLSPGGVERALFLATQLEAIAGRLNTLALELGSFVTEDDELCRWLAVERTASGAPLLMLGFAPVEVGPQLRERLFEAFPGIVLTSATLTVDRRFDFFRTRTGLDLLPEGRVDYLRLDSPFRFADQALLAIPADLPPPDSDGYEDALAATIQATVEASDGGVFVLFTSYAALARSHERLAPRLREAGHPVLRQGDLGRAQLVDRFRRDRRSVLFATDSFWEGVDVRGDDLRALVIARLPFRVPTDPIVQARAEQVEARGGEWFADYVLPLAVIRLRQGFGRLVRSREDRGVVVIADSRIAQRAYGDVFLASLPGARLAIGPSREVLREVVRFFR